MTSRPTLESVSEFKLPAIRDGRSNLLQTRARRRHSIDVSSLMTNELAQFHFSREGNDRGPQTTRPKPNDDANQPRLSQPSPNHASLQTSPHNNWQQDINPLSSPPLSPSSLSPNTARRNRRRNTHSRQPRLSSLRDPAKEIRRASLANLPELDQHFGARPRWQPEDPTDEIIRKESKKTAVTSVFQYLNLPSELIDEDTITESSRQRFENAAARRFKMRTKSHSPTEDPAKATLHEARSRRLGYGAWYRKTNSVRYG